MSKPTFQRRATGRIPYESPNLSMARGIAEGANNFVHAYTGSRMAQAAAAAKAQQMQAVANMRNAQAEQIHANLQPVTVSLQKLNTLIQAAKAGVPGADSQVKKAWQEYMDAQQSPMQAHYGSQAVDQFINSRTNGPNVGAPGSSPQMPPGVRGPSLGMNYGSPLSQPLPAGVAQPGQPPSDSMTFSPQEAKLYGKMVPSMLGTVNTGIKAGAQVDMNEAKQAAALLQTQMKSKVMSDRTAAMREIQQWKNQYGLDLRQLMNNSNEKISAGNNATKVKVAGIGANAKMYSADSLGDSRVDAAKVKATAPAKAGAAQKDPAAQAILKQIQDNNKALNDVTKPDSLGQQPDPITIRTRMADINHRNEVLYDQYKQKTGTDLRVQPAQPAQSSSGQAIAPTGAAAAPSAQPGVAAPAQAAPAASPTASSAPAQTGAPSPSKPAWGNPVNVLSDPIGTYYKVGPDQLFIKASDGHAMPITPDKLPPELQSN